MAQCKVCGCSPAKLCSGCGQAYYCGVQCQKIERNLHKVQCFPVRVEQVEGRGRGIVATRDIKQGQVVMQDCAILTAERGTVTEPDNWASLAAAVAKLTRADQDKFYALQPRQGLGLVGGELLNVQIFTNNGIALAAPGIDSRLGIFPSLSLINHSCSPNAKWSQVKGNREMKEVRAVTMIRKGEEVTCSYFGDALEMTFASRLQRREFLESWSFECICQICALDGELLEKNEKKRMELRKIIDDIEFEQDKVRKARLCLQKLDMVKKMGMEMMSELSYTYQQAYMAGWLTEEDDWRMKAELVRLDWRRWVESLPLHSVRLQYNSVLDE